MAKRHKQRARELRQLLFEVLGHKCMWPSGCNEEEVTKLTFDCIVDRGDKHHKKDTYSRMVFYWREAQLCNIQVLCHKHNSLKGRLSNAMVDWLLKEGIPTSEWETNETTASRPDEPF